MNTSELLWGTVWRKRITNTAASLAALSSAIIGLPVAWSSIGLPEPATREWVMSTVQRPIRLAQASTTGQVIDLQIDLANGKLDQLDNARAALDIEILKSTEDAVKSRAAAQIRKIDRDTSALNEQITALRRARQGTFGPTGQ
jgi:hypothetical protein